MKYVVDSSGWLEYFADSKNAAHFAQTIENPELLIVPSITIYEVFKKILKERNEHLALTVVAHMKQGRVIDLDLDLCLLAGKLARDHQLPMADSIILATAKRHRAIVLTQDSDFRGIEGVKYFAKKN